MFSVLGAVSGLRLVAQRLINLCLKMAPSRLFRNYIWKKQVGCIAAMECKLPKFNGGAGHCWNNMVSCSNMMFEIFLSSMIQF